MEERVECPECGEVYSSRELMERHHGMEHPAERLETGEESFNLGSELRPFFERLPVRFLTGLVLGAALAAALLSGPELLASEGPLTVTVVTCESCSYERFVDRTDRQFDARYVEVDYRSDRGQRLIERYDLSYVPGFILERDVEQRENFSAIRNALVEYPGAYVVSDEGNTVAQRFSTGINLTG